MTEGNFVDYVKIHVASGNGGKGSTHLHRENMYPKVGQMEETEVAADTSFCAPIPIYGLWSLLNLNNTIRQGMESTAARIDLRVQTEKMFLFQFR